MVAGLTKQEALSRESLSQYAVMPFPLKLCCGTRASAFPCRPSLRATRGTPTASTNAIRIAAHLYHAGRDVVDHDDADRARVLRVLDLDGEVARAAVYERDAARDGRGDPVAFVRP